MRMVVISESGMDILPAEAIPAIARRAHSLRGNYVIDADTGALLETPYQGHPAGRAAWGWGDETREED